MTLKIKKLTQIAILSALGSVMRLSLVAFPNVKPITAFFFVLVIYLGLGTALLVASLTMTLTGLLLGFSVIIFAQIVSYAMILTAGYFLFKHVRQVVLQAILAGILTMCWGFLISLFSARLFGSSIWPFWLSGLPFDVAHAVSTALFFPVLIIIFKQINKGQNNDNFR
ncbi:hypothetical protein [Pseudolactococcus insecticola]|uniref:Membrane protein n=1 Tax=Pseudolactococcus insecticola TaxID=2709158 RepID=A0A6A0B724_9LACT|nr:hypothetical protein [Lactococcus insecticola]GFH40278.1 membrane protein [Lactococcus insecticola]